MAHHLICPSSLLLRHGLTDSWQSKGSWITKLKRVSHCFHIPYNNYKFEPSSLPRLLDVRGMSNLPEKLVYGAPKSQSLWKRITLNHLAAKYVKGEPRLLDVRRMSNLPEKLVYGGPKSQSPWKRITLNHLATKYDKREPRLLNVRGMSNLPEKVVYGGPKSQSPWKRITLNHLATKYDKGEPITMVTAYDYPSAVHVDNAGIDICLVGDSVGMVVHGHDTTLPVTLDDMLLHCRAVSRGASRSLLVGDLPFGSYEESKEQAVASATQLLKEGGMDAIKLEGGTPSRVIAARSIVEAGIAVIGHVGLTPQAISVLGGFRPQGRNAASATKVLESALALQDAGCFAIVLECVPSPVAAAITSSLHIPTIGIGAGPNCSGQVLVYHDLLQMTQHPHHAQVTPKFCKAYGNIGIAINEALCKYREEVVSQKFPSAAHTPYRIDQSSVETFIAELSKRGLGKAAQAASLAAENDGKSGEPRISTLPD